MNVRSRLQAFSIHLLLSLAIAGACASLVFLVWYEWPLAASAGVVRVFFVLIFVDVVLGPLLTLLVFDRKKRELRRDLLVIGVLQAAALCYGMAAMFVARPVHMVFAVDRFEIVHANDVNRPSLEEARAEFRQLPLWRPTVIGVQRPDDPTQRRELLLGALTGGPDIHQQPRHYVPFSFVLQQVKLRAQDLSALVAFNPSSSANIQALHGSYEAQGRAVGFIPVRGRVEDLVAVVDRHTGRLLEVVRLKPWSD